MQIKELISGFNELQLMHGEGTLDAICGAGEIHAPDLCLVFMNPTARNVSSKKSWKGIKAPWIGTKNVWNMFKQLDLINENIANKIKLKTPSDWTPEFAKEVYAEVKSKSIYITNLSKATQVDARPLSNKVFREYLDLFKKEIDILNPKVIITFGNQVSSVLLDKKMSLSKYRKKFELLNINKKSYKVFPVYYPVGQGIRNLGVAKEDIKQIIGEYV